LTRSATGSAAAGDPHRAAQRQGPLSGSARVRTRTPSNRRPAWTTMLGESQLRGGPHSGRPASGRSREAVEAADGGCQVNQVRRGEPRQGWRSDCSQIPACGRNQSRRRPSRRRRAVSDFIGVRSFPFATALDVRVARPRIHLRYGNPGSRPMVWRAAQPERQEQVNGLRRTPPRRPPGPRPQRHPKVDAEPDPDCGFRHDSGPCRQQRFARSPPFGSRRVRRYALVVIGPEGAGCRAPPGEVGTRSSGTRLQVLDLFSFFPAAAEPKDPPTLCDGSRVARLGEIEVFRELRARLLCWPFPGRGRRGGRATNIRYRSSPIQAESSANRSAGYRAARSGRPPRDGARPLVRVHIASGRLPGSGPGFGQTGGGQRLKDRQSREDWAFSGASRL